MSPALRGRGQQPAQAALKPRFNVPESFRDIADIDEDLPGDPKAAPRGSGGRGTPQLEQVLVDDMEDDAPPARVGVRVAPSRPAPKEEEVMVDDMSDVVALDMPDDNAEDPTELGSPVSLQAIRDDWLKELVGRAQTLAASFPPQVRLEFSQEENVPFSLVVSRATPAMAVRSLIEFVELLASGPVPPQARIELIGVPQLDKTFHRNVQAALEPHFEDRFNFENEPGRIEIFFTDPDPRWNRWPLLPVAPA